MLCYALLPYITLPGRLYHVISIYVHDYFMTEDWTASAIGVDDKRFNMSNNSLKIGNIEVKLSEGDLTKETTDAIVNSTNESLDLSIGIVLYISIYSKCNHTTFLLNSDVTDSTIITTTTATSATTLTTTTTATTSNLISIRLANNMLIIFKLNCLTCSLTTNANLKNITLC